MLMATKCAALLEPIHLHDMNNRNHPTQFAVQTSEDFWSNATLGIFLGTGVGTISAAILTIVFTSVWSTGAPFLACGLSGMFAGALQGAFVRRYVHPRILWLAISSSGWLAALGAAIAINAVWPVVGLDQGFGVAALAGTIIGSAQWLLLRRVKSDSIWWILLNASVWVAYTLLYFILLSPFIGVAIGD